MSFTFQTDVIWRELWRDYKCGNEDAEWLNRKMQFYNILKQMTKEGEVQHNILSQNLYLVILMEMLLEQSDGPMVVLMEMHLEVM